LPKNLKNYSKMKKQILEFSQNPDSEEGYIFIEAVIVDNAMDMIDEIKNLTPVGAPRFMLEHVEPDYIRARYPYGDEEVLDLLLKKGWRF